MADSARTLMFSWPWHSWSQAYRLRLEVLPLAVFEICHWLWWVSSFRWQIVGLVSLHIIESQGLITNLHNIIFWWISLENPDTRHLKLNISKIELLIPTSPKLARLAFFPVSLHINCIPPIDQAETSISSLIPFSLLWSMYNLLENSDNFML